MFSSTPISVLADEEEIKAKAAIDEAYEGYIGEDGTIADAMSQYFDEDIKSIMSPENRNTIQYILHRSFGAGIYINDVRDGVLAKSIAKPKDEILIDGKYGCDPKAPNNLLNHNCNIPNFGTQLMQTFVASIFPSPLSGANKTTAKAPFGIGVPKGVEDIPAKESGRKEAYTALELFGYDLKYTKYRGEWDRIEASNEAKMLSNFGFMDDIRLIGNAMWNSTKSTIGSWISGFSFNPIKWAQTVVGGFTSGYSAYKNTTMDSEEMNVFATSGWKRIGIRDSLYNVYVLTDKEIVVESAEKFIRTYSKALDDNANKDSTLVAIRDLQVQFIPEFSFVEDWETESSIKAREAAETHNSKETAKKVSADNAITRYEKNKPTEEAPAKYVPKYKTIPEPVYYTESEQLGFWEEDNSDMLKSARKYDILSKKAEDFETYDELVADWTENWEIKKQKEFDVSSEVLKELIEGVDSKIFTEDPYMDPKRDIGRYVCLADDGESPMRDSSGNFEYLYLKDNEGGTQSVNPKCSRVRAPINEGFYGSGWQEGITLNQDTRHHMYVSSLKGISTPLTVLGDWGTSLFASLNSFIAKITNEILNLSFSPLLSELGIDIIINKLMEGFRDTIFFPMSILVAALGAFLLFVKLLQNASALQLIGSVFSMLLIFVIGTAFLMTPDVTLKVIDEWPSRMDNFIANIVLVDDANSDYCSTGNTKDGIRTAQCNVWGAMVFHPWVEGQFGTPYNNLYSLGNAPSGGSSFNNTNGALVGDASVDMGGGKITKNWALYQLSKTKAGSITTEDKSGKLGTIDKDMYRLVDLQAGPNNGSGSDSRYYNDWITGGKSNFGVILIATVQTFALSFAIGTLGVMKIENSFIFALSFLFLPIMLLFALTPQGKNKFKGYVENLGALLLKRVVITVMLGVLLQIVTSVHGTSNSYYTSSLVGTLIAVSFIMYRKELLDLFVPTGNDYLQMKDAVADTIPKSVSQRYQMTKSRAKGTAVGVIGGVAGTRRYNKANEKTAKQLEKRLNKLNKLDDKGKMSEVQRYERDAVMKDIKQLKDFTGVEHKSKSEKLRGMPGNIKNLSEETADKSLEIAKNLADALKEGEGIKDKVVEVGNVIETSAKDIGADTSKFMSRNFGQYARNINRSVADAGGLISRRQERKLRKDGLGLFKVAGGAAREVYKDGAETITEKMDPIAHETYKDMLSEELGKGSFKTSFQSGLDSEAAERLSDPKTQKLVFEEAKRRKKAIEARRESGYSDTDLHRERVNTEKAFEEMQRRKKLNEAKRSIKHPIKEFEIKEKAEAKAKRSENITSSLSEIEKQFIRKKQRVIDRVENMPNKGEPLTESEKAELVEMLMREKEEESE